jgi:hypothetical protein
LLRAALWSAACTHKCIPGVSKGHPWDSHCSRSLKSKRSCHTPLAILAISGQLLQGHYIFVTQHLAILGLASKLLRCCSAPSGGAMAPGKQSRAQARRRHPANTTGAAFDKCREHQKARHADPPGSIGQLGSSRSTGNPHDTHYATASESHPLHLVQFLPLAHRPMPALECRMFQERRRHCQGARPGHARDGTPMQHAVRPSVRGISCIPRCCLRCASSCARSGMMQLATWCLPLLVQAQRSCCRLCETQVEGVCGTVLLLKEPGAFHTAPPAVQATNGRALVVHAALPAAPVTEPSPPLLLCLT